MTMYHNEETAEPIRCPYCGMADDECDHILAIIDRSTGSCDGGELYGWWDEFTGMVRDAFTPVLASGSQPPDHWLSDPELGDLWEYARSNWEPDEPEWVDIDEIVFSSLISELLSSCGSWEYFSVQLEEVMPGGDVVIDLHYAEDPEVILNKALELLRDRLDQARL